MTQPSSLDVALPESSLLFAARSSPIVCVVDTLEIMIELSIYLYQGYNLRQAAWRSNWKRARIRLGRDITILEESAVEKHPTAFLVLFIATVLQTIKILGFQGHCGQKYGQELSFARMLFSLLFNSSHQRTGEMILLPQHFKGNRVPRQDTFVSWIVYY
jgi:hypothetical protein